VVNSCAAALVMISTHGAEERSAGVEGELVESDGSFRIRHHGAERRTWSRSAPPIAPAGDYGRRSRRNEDRQSPCSNFAIRDSLPTSASNDWPHRRRPGLPVIRDLGSGLMVPLDTQLSATNGISAINSGDAGADGRRQAARRPANWDYG
jgi:hypothetical protein